MPPVNSNQENNKDNSKSQIQSTSRNLIIGFTSGTFGAVCSSAFEAAKKRTQSGQLQPWNTPDFYKNLFQHPLHSAGQICYGTKSFVISLAPTSMVQAYVDAKIKDNFSKDSQWTQIAALFVAGSSGALVSAPVEHLVLTEQLQKKGLISALYFWQEKGFRNLFTALPPLFVREAIFGAAMLGGAKKAGEKLAQVTNHPDNSMIKFAGSIGVGLFGAWISHPFDTIGTRKQQVVLEEGKTISSLEAGKRIVKESGVKGLYKGVGHRSLLFTTAMLSISGGREFLNNHLPRDFSFFKANKPLPQEKTEQLQNESPKQRK